MSVRLDIDVPRGAEAPSVARATIQDHLADVLLGRELTDAQLIVTELVANAVVHGEGEIRVHLAIDRHVLRGEVIDEGRGFETAVRERGIEDVGGRGLMMVGSVAQSWGIHEGSSHVWFEIAREDVDDEPTGPELGRAQRPDELD